MDEGSSLPLPNDKDALEDQLSKLEARIDWANDQIQLLYGQLEGVKKRYNRAYKDNRRSFRYHIRLRIITYEGTINAFYEYACQKEKEAKRLRLTMYDDLVDQNMSSSDEGGESEEEEE